MVTPTASRWWMVAMLCAISTISYMERVNVTVIGGSLMQEFRLDQTQAGWVFSAFTLGYALFQIPAGVLADRLGPRRVLAGALLCWGASTVLTAAAGSPAAAGWWGMLYALLAIRFLFGIAEAPTSPAAGCSIARWVPADGR